MAIINAATKRLEVYARTMGMALGIVRCEDTWAFCIVSVDGSPIKWVSLGRTVDEAKDALFVYASG